ncbi:uncharacterized protein LOC125226050 [Leguminivora glycinivorella]|uniref:uncharacterized protein LOC125226050 n=1 Tax=Leguminivora glycinivorella TaxID=1035111 RepID=UPI00200D72C0|nr:uncharacterized protein LOC125226050 [Leguminivora glycinivorella]
MDGTAQPETQNPSTVNPENEKAPTGKQNTPSGNKKSVDPRLKDWTKDEIYELLQTIKVFGSQNVTCISQSIPTKSEQQIKDAIECYKERAVSKHNPIKRKMWYSRKHCNRPPIPLISWAKFLQDSLTFKDLHTETATALRIIAEFDNIPPAASTENIDFRNLYHALANAMEGKAIADDGPMLAILNKCIVDTALTSKAFMRLGTLQNIIEWIDMSEKPCVLPRPTDNFELATLRHLASQRTYNPLGIPEQYLKPI